MNQELILKLNYSYSGQSETTSLPSQIQESIQLISNYFENNSNNKLCLVFPSKELAAQWISFILAFQLIEQDYRQFNTEIYKAYEKYKPGQKLLLNNKAIVEWVTGNEEEIKFKTKGKTIKSRPWENTQGDIITVRTSRIVKLRPAPQSRKVLSARESVYSNLSGISQTPIDTLLSINTCDNLIFQKNSIALVSKFKDFDNSHYDVLINGFKTEEYFKASKIYENGSVAFKSPLLIANNLSNIALYSVINPIAKIIIDGFAAIHERTTDFADIDVKNIPTILITDLSEIERFEAIGNFGFDFFNFTKENIDLSHFASLKPFRPFEIKLRNYISLNVIKEICHDAELELASQKIYSIEKDESNNELTLLKLSLVQLINFVSRISHILTASEIIYFNSKVAAIENLIFSMQKVVSIPTRQLKKVHQFGNRQFQKINNKSVREIFSRLKLLLSSKKYEYIILPNERSKSFRVIHFIHPLLILR
ncbi:MAG: DrmE family protein [Ferruginibacter sp.]